MNNQTDHIDWQGMLFSGGVVAAVLWIILGIIVAVGWAWLPWMLYYRLRAIEREVAELRLAILWKVDSQEARRETGRVNDAD